MCEKQDVSQEVERLYVETLVSLLKPHGRVLEIGFNQGHASSHIRTCQPVDHVIIEPDPVLYQQALHWSKNDPRVEIKQGCWEDILPNLGVFDSIIVGDFFPKKTTLPSASSPETLQARALLQKEKELHNLIEKNIPELSHVHYSDQDIEEFFLTTAPHQKKEISYFMSELQQKGHITEKQYRYFCEKYQLTPEIIKVAKKTGPTVLPLSALLMACLTNHMKRGSRFASFLNEGISYFEDPEFFEHIITNPSLDYQEKPISIPEKLDQEFLVMLVEKLDD